MEPTTRSEKIVRRSKLERNEIRFVKIAVLKGDLPCARSVYQNTKRIEKKSRKQKKIDLKFRVLHS